MGQPLKRRLLIIATNNEGVPPYNLLFPFYISIECHVQNKREKLTSSCFFPADGTTNIIAIKCFESS